MTFGRLAAFLVLFAGVPAAAAPPPRLIVAISVDQFSADLFAEYRQHFTGGLKRLSEGAVFPSGYQSHAATETCPGHSTILTGARPSRSGIIANTWYDLGVGREDKAIYCAEDESVAGSSSTKYTASAVHLKAPALGDYLKRADRASRTVSVAGKDRAALMMGGHGPDQVYYWGGEKFVTNGNAAAPASVAAVNAAVARTIAQPREPLALPALCQSRLRPVAVGGGGKPVGDGRFARAAGDAKAFRASPEADAAVLALAAALRRELKLGEGRATDLLAIGVSATDYVGHSYGTRGSEMCLQLLSLDRDLGDFFSRLDAAGVDYAVVLTADHGGLDLPERSNAQAGAGAARVDPALAARTMGQALGVRLGLPGPLLYGDGPFGDMYVDRALTPAQRSRVLDEAVKAYRAHPQVADVYTAAAIQAAPAPSGPPDTWSLLSRVKASYHAGRSGDFVVLLKPRVTPIADTSRGYVATHGSPWDYDRRVPILFWRKGMTPFEQALAVETVDILPTLAALTGVPIPAGSIDGRCLDLDAGPATSCR